MGSTNIMIGLALTLGQTHMKPLSKAEIERGKSYYLAGVAHYEKRRFQKAVEAFEASYQISNAPELMYNIGLAQKELGHDAEAMKSFSVYYPHANPKQQTELGDKFISMCNTVGSFDFCMRLIDSRYTKASSMIEANRMALVCNRFEAEKRCIDRYKTAWNITKDPIHLRALSKRHRLNNNIESAIETLSLYLQLNPQDDESEQLAKDLNELKAEQSRLNSLKANSNSDKPNPKHPPDEPHRNKTTLALASLSGIGLAVTIGTSIHLRDICHDNICMQSAKTAKAVNLISAMLTDIALVWLTYHLWKTHSTPLNTPRQP